MRFVLIRPPVKHGLSGRDEQRAFDQLPAVPSEVSKRLCEEARQRMVPAATEADFDAFSESVYRFGVLAGGCFADAQGGAYNGRELESLVQLIRSLGVSGVGQSSWGPTLFAVLPDQPAAESFQGELAESRAANDLHIQITAPDNDGAIIDS